MSARSQPVAPAAGGEESMGPELLDTCLTECVPLYGVLLECSRVGPMLPLDLKFAKVSSVPF